MTVRPGDWTPLDLARAIARQALAELRKAAPERHAMLVRWAVALGQGWVAPPAGEIPPGERLSTAAVSAETGIPESTIRRWGADPKVPVRRKDGGWDLHEVLAHQANQRRQHQDLADLAAELGKRYTAGATIAELAEEIDRSEHFVVTRLRKAGVTLRRRGHR